MNRTDRRAPRRIKTVKKLRLLIPLLFFAVFLSTVAYATDVVINGTFDSNISGWNHSDNANGSVSWDNVVYGSAAGSIKNLSNTGRNITYACVDSQLISATINSTDTVFLSLYWYKFSAAIQAANLNITIDIIKPDNSTDTLWSNSSLPAADNFIDGTVTNLDVSALFDQTGNYYIKLVGDMKNGNNTSAYNQFNFDDVILDVRTGSTNAPPTVSAGATQVVPDTVNRFGANTTVISTDFNDSDQPGVGAFNVTFRIREPNDITELTLVNNQPNGAGGLTITDNGGGSYTASYTYNPSDVQTLGDYDLYFEVTDGTDNAIDNYADNLNELTIIESLPNNAPTVTAGATQVVPDTVNRFGANTTVVSTDFNDTDQPGVGAFNVTFRIREPNDVTELTLVNNQPNGGGGLTITDNGGGSYTASYTYDPGPAQTLGAYDLYFEVTDGIDNAIDAYADNLNELEIIEDIPNNPPSVVAGATQVSPDTVNRVGTNTTVISTVFSDSDQPGVGAFNVTFKIREPNNITELTLVNSQPNGGGGLTITDNGGGSYTASYTFDPGPAQNLGSYDLYFEATDGTDNAIDAYADNLDELEIIDSTPNSVPQITAGASQAVPDSVNRFGADSTVISADFSDGDQPGVGAFNVTIKIREPNDVTELTLVNNQPNGSGGLTIADNGGGSYTASYTYNPADAQTTGLYDLYFEVTDGQDNAIDGYANNLDELNIYELIINNPPVVTSGATLVTLSPVNRLGSTSTTIRTTFSDPDQPGVGVFNVTFKIREPDNSTEVVLVNSQPNGGGGLIITDDGGGTYTASFVYDPLDTQTLGFYDLYFEVTDGSDNAIDSYLNNPDELEINEVILNNPPQFTQGMTSVNPSSIDRFGAITTDFSATFTDSDQPGINAFYVTFRARSQYSYEFYFVSDAYQNGQNGMVITDNGGGSYTATMAWDPPDNAFLGYYDLYCMVSDGIASGIDSSDSNPDELLITNGGENAPPIAPADNIFATPAAVERIGANSVTLSCTFTDGDAPGVTAFNVSFKLRLPDNSSELVLADSVSNGQSGVSIADLGGGVYTATVSWDPPDAQTPGFYDLYFQVSDGIDISYDGYSNNLDELEIYDAVTNNAPTLVAGTTHAIPPSVNRIGSEYTMIKAAFSDADMPGRGAFRVTIRVRDQASTEYTIADTARHGLQGLRIVHDSADTYEASVLWYPPDGQATGTYDLYFYVEDNSAASAVDGYANNADELTITSTAIAGDGNILRRTNNADNCGGASSACHNIANHQTFNCLTCHTPHSTSNVYMIRDTIQTPGSGNLPVIFKTLGIGDPYNDPDPTPGDPTSGVMADSSDGVFTGICEVCHTGTNHHRNDGSQPDTTNHNDAVDCTGCHPHTEGFAVSGGGESSGGQNCVCHNSIFTPMNSSTTSYHHQINSNSPDYTISSRTCLTCHVDHNIFRPDLNSVGQRAKNLRVNITSAIDTGDGTVLANSDYSSSGTGGICLSCHTSTQSKGYSPPDGSVSTVAISKTDFDAATSTHNFNVTSTYGDGSTFNANCVKCHNDTMTKTHQTSADKFSAHDNPYGRILNPLGASSPSDPLEEKVCFGCHSTTSNPNAGSSQDYYGVKTMSSTALRIEDAFSKTFSHPTLDSTGLHSFGETGPDLADGNRHAECGDCHDMHSAVQGTHDGSSNLVSNALKGAWGVEPTSWPTPAVPTDNGNVYTAPSGFTRVEPAVREWQICLKCHSNYTTLPTGNRNLAAEINPLYPSTHGIVVAGLNPFCNTTTLLEPWGSANEAASGPNSGIVYCSDCHSDSSSTGPSGPHGSNVEHLLVATIVSNNTVGTPLCYVCHSEPVYWSDRNLGVNSRYEKHPSIQGNHAVTPGCFACHMWDYASTPGNGLQTVDDYLNAGTIHIHGMNRKWVYNERTANGGTPGSGEPVISFINGYLANLDSTSSTNIDCYAETCKDHSPQSYTP